MELDLRGTDLATMKDYFQLLGAAEESPNRMVGPGWSASLTEGVHRWAGWEFPRVIIRLEGDPESLAEVTRRLKIMTMRGGA